MNTFLAFAIVPIIIGSLLVLFSLVDKVNKGQSDNSNVGSMGETGSASKGPSEGSYYDSRDHFWASESKSGDLYWNADSRSWRRKL